MTDDELNDPVAPPEPPPSGATIAEKLAAPFATTFTDPRGFTYISGEQVARRLIQVLGVGGWSFRVIKETLDIEADEVVVLGELTAEIDGKIVVRQQYGSQKHNRSKALCGFTDNESGEVCNDKAWDHDKRHDHRFVDGGRGPILDSGFDHMGAATTSMKKCASWLGVGLYLSRKNEEPQQTRRQDAPRQQAPRQIQRPATPSGPVLIPCGIRGCTKSLTPTEANASQKQYHKVLCSVHAEAAEAMETARAM